MINFFSFVLLYFLALGSTKESPTINQKQEFEGIFSIVNAPAEFLPRWTGNELRATSSRIFRTVLGRNGSKGLAVQPILSFSGVLTINLINEDYKNPKVVFWARSLQNSTGTRAAVVFISWKSLSDADFSIPVVLGSLLEFKNENQEFRKFEIDIPGFLRNNRELSLRIEIKYGSGTGSAARWIMDDFEFGDFPIDLEAPVLTQIRGYDSNQLELIFSEPLDPIFPILNLNYSLGAIEPEQVTVANDSLIYLTFQENLTQGEDYTLGIKQIPDLAGNFLRDTLATFIYFDPTAIPSKGLVINEIMPAPRANQDLPNVEYVELFHAGDFPYRLKDVSWANSKKEVKLNEFWIFPGELLLLVPQNQGAPFRPFGKVLELSNWPTLLNSADQVRVETDQGDLIDELIYATASWGGSGFADGGFSLEIANPFYACDQSDLLNPSRDPQRGTPGRVNSVFDLQPDTEAPKLEDGFFVNSTTIQLLFSEPIRRQAGISNFIFTPNISIDSVSFSNSQTIQVKLSSEAIPNQIYQLVLNGVSDCLGNKYVQAENYELILSVAAKKGDVILNELLFNPKTGGPKFVELYNRTDSYLEIGDWKLANLDERGVPDQIRNLSATRLQISPKSYMAITTNIDRLKMEYPQATSGRYHLLSTLPSYPISSGNVVLLDSQNQEIETFVYDDDLHHPLLRDPKGVSLERISSESPAGNTSNWHSASGIAGYATPGLKNSQLISNEFDSQIIQIEPKIFDPEGSNGNTFSSIRYELDQSGWLGSFRIYAISGQLIQVLAQNELLGAKGLFTWTGTDSQGRIVRPGYYILLVELYNLDGSVKTIKETIVVATRF